MKLGNLRCQNALESSSQWPTFLKQRLREKGKEKKHCLYVSMWVCTLKTKTPTHIKTTLSCFRSFCASMIPLLCKSDQSHLMSAFPPVKVGAFSPWIASKVLAFPVLHFEHFWPRFLQDIDSVSYTHLTLPTKA